MSELIQNDFRMILQEGIRCSVRGSFYCGFTVFLLENHGPFLQLEDGVHHA